MVITIYKCHRLKTVLHGEVLTHLSFRFYYIIFYFKTKQISYLTTKNNHLHQL